MKKQERAELYAAIDDMAEKALCDKEALSTYLTLQANLGRTSVNNTLLVMAQKPDATFVCDAEVWQERGRSIRKGEGKNAIKQFMQDREYTREDGSIAMGYKVVRCFDISQPMETRLQKSRAFHADEIQAESTHDRRACPGKTI